MTFEANNKYSEFARCDSFNTSDSNINMSVTFADGSVGNIKIGDFTGIEIGKVYEFTFECIFNGTRNQNILKSYKDALECEITDKLLEVLPVFYSYVPVGIKALEEKLDYYLDMIKNPILKAITLEIMNKYRREYLIYPAAVKMHHNYIGGLAYHSLTMCDLAKGMAGIYTYLDIDYLICGCILHDVAKVIEFASPTSSEYSVKGQLLGHLVLGAIVIDDTAKKLGYSDSEEVLMLEHMIVAHHGNPQFGACKKPETPEALILWLLDTIDSKMRVIDDTYPRVDAGDFTESLGVLEKMKFYKKKDWEK